MVGVDGVDGVEQVSHGMSSVLWGVTLLWGGRGGWEVGGDHGGDVGVSVFDCSSVDSKVEGGGVDARIGE